MYQHWTTVHTFDLFYISIRCTQYTLDRGHGQLPKTNATDLQSTRVINNLNVTATASGSERPLKIRTTDDIVAAWHRSA